MCVVCVVELGLIKLYSEISSIFPVETDFSEIPENQKIDLRNRNRLGIECLYNDLRPCILLFNFQNHVIFSLMDFFGLCVDEVRLYADLQAEGQLLDCEGALFLLVLGALVRLNKLHELDPVICLRILLRLRLSALAELGIGDLLSLDGRGPVGLWMLWHFGFLGHQIWLSGGHRTLEIHVLLAISFFIRRFSSGVDPFERDTSRIELVAHEQAVDVRLVVAVLGHRTVQPMHHFMTRYEVTGSDVLPRRVEVSHETEHELRLRQHVACLAGADVLLRHRHDQRLLVEGLVFRVGNLFEDPRNGALRLAPGVRSAHL